MRVVFDVPQLYYLPQYLPVWHELKSRNAEGVFVFYPDPDMGDILKKVAQVEELPVKWVSDNHEALHIFKEESPDWVIFGNSFPCLGQIPGHIRSAMLYHGAGVKACYFDEELMNMTVRFVEGKYRYEKLSRLYPDATIESVGFAKLDPLFLPDKRKKIQFNLEQNGLDTSKPTILYAPTFYPSSIELMADDWPLQFSEYNLIVKPHFFTVSKKKYHNQRRKIERWKNYENTYIAKPEDYSLLPFMAVSDLLISEASSAFFEFAALDKPIVWCDFLKLRMGYKGLFKFRFNKRMDADIDKYRDIGMHAEKYKHLKKAVDSQITHPDQFKTNRERFVKELIGESDGRTAKRIVDYLYSKGYE
ncbi:MAG: CDP-glycerol glycerophosphotransferase family protein [Proteobacteria bacterium]|nr:CDP-glycerol glycerophosphotransferase family protein [Pseudomonadota bacterium]